jgi:hypothetical protein
MSSIGISKDSRYTSKGGTKVFGKEGGARRGGFSAISEVEVRIEAERRGERSHNGVRRLCCIRYEEGRKLAIREDLTWGTLQYSISKIIDYELGRSAMLLCRFKL